MATRARTGLFKHFRDTSNNDDKNNNINHRSFDETNDVIIQLDDDSQDTLLQGPEAAARPPSWVNDADVIKQQIEDIKRKIRNVSSSTDNLPKFGAIDAKSKETEANVAAIRVALMDCGNNLKALGNKHKLNKKEMLVRDNVQSDLAAKLQKLSTQFYSMEQIHESNVEKLQKKGYTLDSDDDEKDDETEPWRVGFAEMTQIDIDQRHLRERKREIKKIARSMVELRSLFTDISGMVLEQGTVLDRIDQNLIETEHNVVAGIVELTGASKTSSKNTKCWLGFLVILVIFTIVIVFLIRGRRT